MAGELSTACIDSPGQFSGYIARIAARNVPREDPTSSMEAPAGWVIQSCNIAACAACDARKFGIERSAMFSKMAATGASNANLLGFAGKCTGFCAVCSRLIIYLCGDRRNRQAQRIPNLRVVGYEVEVQSHDDCEYPRENLPWPSTFRYEGDDVAVEEYVEPE